MTFDPIISIASMATGFAGIFFVLRAYQQTIKSAEPDPAVVRRFVETAPVKRLGNIKIR